jgi:hypothetical protein
MANHRCLLVLAILLLLPNSSWAKQAPDKQRGARAPQTRRPQEFRRAQGSGESEPFSFDFSLAGCRYRITNDGRGQRFSGRSPSTPFNLKLRAGDHLEAVSYAEYAGDLLLICEVCDYESGAGLVMRLDGRTLRAKWAAAIPGFNLGPGLIEGRFIYLTATGFVAKLDLRSGAYVWRRDGLSREPDSFNAFERPRVVGSVVLFKERNFFDGETATFKVDKRRGLVLLPGAAPTSRRAQRQAIKRVYVSTDGNIHIVPHQGKEISATKTGDGKDPKIAADRRTVGWLVTGRLDPEHPDVGHPEHLVSVAEKLVIYRNGRVIRVIMPGGFIREWRFRNKGTQVVIYAGGLHFAGTYALYEVATGRELGRCLEWQEQCPEWAKDS